MSGSEPPGPSWHVQLACNAREEGCTGSIEHRTSCTTQQRCGGHTEGPGTPENKDSGRHTDGAQAPGGCAAWQLQRHTLGRSHILLRKSPGRADVGAGVHKES